MFFQANLIISKKYYNYYMINYYNIILYLLTRLFSSVHLLHICKQSHSVSMYLYLVLCDISGDSNTSYCCRFVKASAHILKANNISLCNMSQIYHTMLANRMYNIFHHCNYSILLYLNRYGVLHYRDDS